MISPNKNSKSIYRKLSFFSLSSYFIFFPEIIDNVNERNLLTIDRNLNFFVACFCYR